MSNVIRMPLKARLPLAMPAGPEAKVIPIVSAPFMTRRPLLEADELFREALDCDEDPKRYARAEYLYRRALALDPDNPDCWTSFGAFTWRRGTDSVRYSDRDFRAGDWKDVHREAMACFKRAIELDPKHPESLYNLGYMMLYQGHLRAAMKRFHAALVWMSNAARMSEPLARDIQQMMAETQLALDAKEAKR